MLCQQPRAWRSARAKLLPLGRLPRCSIPPGRALVAAVLLCSLTCTRSHTQICSCVRAHTRRTHCHAYQGGALKSVDGGAEHGLHSDHHAWPGEESPLFVSLVDYAHHHARHWVSTTFLSRVPNSCSLARLCTRCALVSASLACTHPRALVLLHMLV